MKKIIIGIAGVSGSGKTTISKILAKKLKAKLVHLDDYWKYHKAKKIPSKKEWKKWEHPSATNFNKALKEIAKIKNNKNIIVDGLHPFNNKKLRSLFDLSVYVTLPKHLVVKRRLDKFGPEDNQEWYSKNIVVSSYKKYGEPTKKHAHLIIKGNENINNNIKKILNYVNKLK